MADTDRLQVVFGAALLLFGTAVVLGVSGWFVPGAPAVLGTLSALGLAAGALLLGTSGGGRPV